MTLSPAFLDELRARISLSGVIGRRVKLARAGREMKGCCPFHNEKSPSFFVNDDKGFYHCFGCGAHGDVIRFVVEQEGLGFIDAVKTLAAEAGLALPEASPEARERAAAANSLHDVTAAAARFFAAELRRNGGGAASAYAAARGLSAATIETFGLGYAADTRSGLRTALREHGEAKLVEAGLLIAPDADAGSEAPAPYDRFRGRLMFPIRDPRGRVIAFGGRILGDGQPKYLNSPDTSLFDKGRTLYNLDRAGPVARKSQRLIVVEGYMDVIALAQAGVEDVVAPLGTALTEAQLALLWRYAPEPVLCFDGDAAGQRAASRAALRALPLLEPGRSLRFATLPAGQDPDDLVRTGGAQAFKKILGSSRQLFDLLWDDHAERVAAATPEARAAIRVNLRNLARSIGDRDVRAQYDLMFNERFNRSFGAPGARPAPRLALVTPSSAMMNINLLEAEMLALVVGIVNYPAVASEMYETLIRIPHHRFAVRNLSQRIIQALSWAPDLDRYDLAARLKVEGFWRVLLKVRAANNLRMSFTTLRRRLSRAPDDLRAFIRAVDRYHAIREELDELNVRARASHIGEGGAAFMTELERTKLQRQQQLAAHYEELYQHVQTHIADEYDPVEIDWAWPDDDATETTFTREDELDRFDDAATAVAA